jgi:hypothetical protein
MQRLSFTREKAAMVDGNGIKSSRGDRNMDRLMKDLENW